jgi:two-component system, NtrC family, nitrogen regulation response regulator NtrX
MSIGARASETILIVDDEPAVRKTFEEWLDGADLGCRVLSVADAEAALQQANQESIDLAVLDWNLGAGNDGLQLLEDLFVFNPDIVAIMVTGYAHQATPLDAMRMGVRDYLDKNQDLNRETFLKAVRRQLERIRPAKRERRLHQSLVAFREAVEKVLPLVQSAAALTDPVPLPDAVRSLFRFLLQSTGASDGVLLTRSYDPGRQPEEICRVYESSGAPLTTDLVPFARSVAGTAVSMQQASIMNRLQDTAGAQALELQTFERGRQSLLAVPLAVAPGVHVVLELFDKRREDGTADPDGFTESDRQTVGAAAEVGAELLRQALAQRNVQQVLFDAIGRALEAGDSVSESLRRTAAERLEQPPSAPVLDQLREGLRASAETPADAEATLRLAEAIRVLTLRHGPPALHHCLRLVEDVRRLLDTATGSG